MLMNADDNHLKKNLGKNVDALVRVSRISYQYYLLFIEADVHC
jgi:hypothetical protein